MCAQPHAALMKRLQAAALGAAPTPGPELPTQAQMGRARLLRATPPGRPAPGLLHSSGSGPRRLSSAKPSELPMPPGATSSARGVACARRAAHKRTLGARVMHAVARNALAPGVQSGPRFRAGRPCAARRGRGRQERAQHRRLHQHARSQRQGTGPMRGGGHQERGSRTLLARLGVADGRSRPGARSASVVLRGGGRAAPGAASLACRRRASHAYLSAAVSARRTSDWGVFRHGRLGSCARRSARLAGAPGCTGAARRCSARHSRAPGWLAPRRPHFMVNV